MMGTWRERLAACILLEAATNWLVEALDETR